MVSPKDTFPDVLVSLELYSDATSTNIKII
ncbi:hypothetical protein COLO4_37711 [Corchorus olitorius]|uniref:Uncharacterized protein n=1 Tax=Corchorus olitorius TaxID=93759 RepID=A0A1R3FZV6_9ROSI|nr:hypothetical protein COLO4_37711 [Corchorus olitorius]